MGWFRINSWKNETIFNLTKGKIDLEIEVTSPDSAEEFPNMLRYLYGGQNGNSLRIFSKAADIGAKKDSRRIKIGHFKKHLIFEHRPLLILRIILFYFNSI